jgi:hypothetical protein
MKLLGVDGNILIYYTYTQVLILLSHIPLGVPTYFTEIFNEYGYFPNGSSDLTVSLAYQSNLQPPHRTCVHSSPRPTEPSDKLAPYNQQQRKCDLSGLRRFFVMKMFSLLDSFGYQTWIKVNLARSVSVSLHFKNDELQKITT